MPVWPAAAAGLVIRAGAAVAPTAMVRMPEPEPRALVAVIVTALVAAGRAQGLPAPNADLALAGLTYAMGLRPGSAAAIFTVSRLVGLLAHAIEEYPHRLRFRPRASYIGTVPVS